jgi:hypothetical protein
MINLPACSKVLMTGYVPVGFFPTIGSGEDQDADK